MLHIKSANANPVHGAVYNAVGQLVWSGDVTGNTDIAVATWAKGVYYIRFADAVNGNTLAKTVVIE